MHERNGLVLETNRSVLKDIHMYSIRKVFQEVKVQFEKQINEKLI